MAGGNCFQKPWFWLHPSMVAKTCTIHGRISCKRHRPKRVVIAPSGWHVQNGRAPFLATILYPVLKLLSNITQKIASNPLPLPIGIKETDYSLGLLKRLNQSVQKNPIKTTVAKFDAILMMFAGGVFASSARPPPQAIVDWQIAQQGWHCHGREAG